MSALQGSTAIQIGEGSKAVGLNSIAIGLGSESGANQMVLGALCRDTYIGNRHTTSTVHVGNIETTGKVYQKMPGAVVSGTTLGVTDILAGYVTIATGLTANFTYTVASAHDLCAYLYTINANNKGIAFDLIVLNGCNYDGELVVPSGYTVMGSTHLPNSDYTVLKFRLLDDVTETWQIIAPNITELGVTGMTVDTNNFTGILSSENYEIQRCFNEIDAVSLYTHVGFANRTANTLSYNEPMRTVTLACAPAGKIRLYGTRGPNVKYTDQTVTWPAVEGLHYVYFDNTATFVWSQTPWDLSQHVPVAALYWSTASNGVIMFADERHLISMNSGARVYLHNVLNTQWISGFALDASVDQDGTADTHAQIQLSTGSVADEDLTVTVTAPYNALVPYSQSLALPAQIPVYARTGASGWQVFPGAATGIPFIGYTDTRLPAINTGAPAWTTQAVTNGYYFAAWVFATNNIRYPIVAIAGQQEHADLMDAKTFSTVDSLQFGTIPFTELRLLYTLIYQASSAYTNAYKARLVHVTDMRTVNTRITANSLVPPQHNTLAGRQIAGAHPASAVATQTATLNGLLSGAAPNIQAALEQLDNVTASQLPVDTTGFGNILTNDSNSNTVQKCIGKLEDINKYMPHGFESRANSYLTSSGTAVQLVTTANTFVYISGVRHPLVVGTLAVTKTADDTVQYVYFDAAGILSISSIAYNVKTQVPVAVCYYSAAQASFILLADERHTIAVSPELHTYLHETIGMRHGSGLVTSAVSAGGDGSADSHAQISLTDGTLFDDDIEIGVTSPAAPLTLFSQTLRPLGTLDVFYMLNNTWRMVGDSTLPAYGTVGSRLSYNAYSSPNWSLVTATNGAFVATWIAGTNRVSNPIVAVIGQREDATLTAAQTNNTVATLSLLPFFQEWKILYRLIFECSDTFINTYKCRLVDIQDLRGSVTTSVYSAMNHATLSGLTSANVHPASSIFADATAFDKKLGPTDTNVQLALDKLDDHTHTAAESTTNVGGFSVKLSSADTDVQKALDTLDDHAHSALETTVNTTGFTNILLGTDPNVQKAFDAVDALPLTLATASSSYGIGVGALSHAVGAGNTAVGASAGTSITLGTNNVCVGNAADASATNSEQIAVGHGATTTGANAIAIGSGVTAGANQIVIGNDSNVNTIIKGLGSDNVLISTSNFDYQLTPAENTVQKALDKINDIVKYEPHGYYRRNDNILELDVLSSPKRVWVKFNGNPIEYFVNGTRYQIVSAGGGDIGRYVELPDTTALNYVYFTPAGLQVSTTRWTYGVEVPVATVYTIVGSDPVYFADERHELAMDTKTLQYIHETDQVRYNSGLDLSYVAGGGTLDSDAQITLTDGVLYDADMKLDVQHAAVPAAFYEQQLRLPAALLPVFYRDGTVWNRKAASAYPAYTDPISRLRFNSYSAPNWSTIEADESYFVASFVVATNDVRYPVAVVLGQRQDATLITAQNNNSFSGLDLSGFPALIASALYRVIFETSSGYTNVPKARIVDVVDLRRYYSIVPHSALTGLQNANAHPATGIVTSTTAFAGLLTATEDTVQKALDKLDDVTHTTLSDRAAANSHPAAAIQTAAFTGMLPAVSSDVQSCLQTLSSVTHTTLSNRTDTDSHPASAIATAAFTGILPGTTSDVQTSLQTLSSVTHTTLSNRTDANSHPATAIQTDTTAFDGVLTNDSDSNTVQKCLDKLDNHTHTSGGMTVNTSAFGTVPGRSVFQNTTAYDTVQKCLDIVDDHSHYADVTAVVTTGFSGVLTDSASSDTVQKCLDIIDDHTHNAGATTVVTTSFGTTSGRSIFTNDTASDTVQKCLDILDDHAHHADQTATTTTGFTNLLSGTDTTVQTALQTLNSLPIIVSNNNAAIGTGALSSVAGGIKNTMLGYNSGRNTTTGASNVCVGDSAGSTLVTGNRNIVIGAASAVAIDDSSQIAIGYNASTSGTNAIAIGDSASASANTTVIGTPSTTTATIYGLVAASIAVGTPAFTKTLAGKTTVRQALSLIDQWSMKLDPVQNNYGIGTSALLATTTGQFNVGLGAGAGDSITSGSENVCVGYLSDAAAAVSYQVAIGSNAVTSGANSIAIGKDATAAANQTVIGNATTTDAVIYGLKTTSFATIVTNFDNLLSGADTDVQKALDTLDNVPKTYSVGFENRTDTVLTRTTNSVTIGPSATSFSVFVDNIRFKKTTPTTISALTTEPDGLQYVWYDSTGTLQITTTIWDIAPNAAPVAILYWDTSLNTGAGGISYFGDERHTIIMDYATHKYLHATVGTRYASGLTLTATTTGNGNTNSDAQGSLTGGVIYDEDLMFTIVTPQSPGIPYTQTLAPTGSAQIPKMYRLGGSSWRVDTSAGLMPYLVESALDTTLIKYNQNVTGNWQLTSAPNNNFVAYWVCATNNADYPVMIIVGQTVSTSLASAQSANTLAGISWGVVPFSEIKVIYRVIAQTANGYSNAVKAKVVDIQDLRATSTLPTSTYTATAHSSLSGLTDANAHPATAITTDTAAFNGLLSGTETDVQKALDKLDDVTATSIPTGAFDGNLTGATTIEAALQLLDNATFGASTAAGVTTVTTGFNGLLSGADTDVQKALDTLDNVTSTNITTGTFDGNLTGATTVEAALQLLDNATFAGAAASVTTVTAGFNGLLSGTDTDVQKALDTLDNVTSTSITTGAFDGNLAGATTVEAALQLLDNATFGGGGTAATTTTDTAFFSGFFSTATTDVQKALDKVDDIVTASNGIVIGMNGGTGTYSVSIGYTANGGAGGTCTSIGHNANATSPGADNTVVGYNGMSNCTGVAGNCTAIGARVLENVGTTVSNTGVGCGCLKTHPSYPLTGNANVAVGYAAMEATDATAHTFARNVGVGYGALPSVTSAQNNVAIGYCAAQNATTGSYNVNIGSSSDSGSASSGTIAIGNNATATGTGAVCVGACITAAPIAATASGAYSIAIGSGAAVDEGARATADYGISVGNKALVSIVDGVAIGRLAQSTAEGSVSIGYNANAASGGHATAVGYMANGSAAGGDITACGYNAMGGAIGDCGGCTAAGSGALQYATTALTNTAYGFQALQTNVSNPLTGVANVAVGAVCMQTNAATAHSFDYNTGVGYSAVYSITTGTRNVGIGNAALFALTTGQYNTAVGNTAGYLITTGTFNTCIGHNAQCNADKTGNVCIGVNANCSTDNGVAIGNAARASADGNVAIGFDACPASLTTATETVAIGKEALKALTSAFSNTAVGYNSMTAATTGQCNTCLGARTGKTITTGFGNVCIGYDCGCDTTARYTVLVGSGCRSPGNDNVAIGYSTMSSNTWGADNVAIGIFAYQYSAASSNIAIGPVALSNNSTKPMLGANNIAIGGWAMRMTDTTVDHTAANNIAIGTSALQEITSGSANVGIGQDTLKYSGAYTDNVAVGPFATRYPMGSYNVAMGTSALSSNDGVTAGGEYNVAIGYKAMTNNIATNRSGTSRNVAVGANSMFSGDLSNAVDNVCVGYQAGNTITTGTNNTCIGSGSDTVAAATTNAIAIGFGTTAGSNSIVLGNSSHTTCYIYGIVGPSSGSGVFYNSTTKQLTYTTSSIRYKENVADYTADPFVLLNQLRPRTYNLKAETTTPRPTYLGYIAEEVDPIDRQYVGYDGENNEIPATVYYDRFTVPLVAAVVSLQKQVTALQNTVAAMQTQLDALTPK